LAGITTQTDSHEYLCNACYTKKDWHEVMPTGYEDLRKYKDIVVRAKRLGHTAFTRPWRKIGLPADGAP
jgi:hypothetical protein